MTYCDVGVAWHISPHGMHFMASYSVATTVYLRGELSSENCSLTFSYVLQPASLYAHTLAWSSFSQLQQAATSQCWIPVDCFNK